MIVLIESLASGILWAAPCILLAALFSRATTSSIGKGLLAAYPLFFGSQVVLSRLLGAAGLLARSAMWIAYGAATAAGVFLYLALTAATKVTGHLTEAFRFYVFELGFRRSVMPQVFDHDFLHYGYLYSVLLLAGSAAAIRQVWRRQYTPTALVLAKIRLPRGRAENCWCGRAGVCQPAGRSGWEVRWVAS